MSSRSQAAVILAIATLAALFGPSVAQASFGLTDFSTVAKKQNGTIETQAAARPFEYTFSFTMNQDSEGNPEGKLRDAIVDLPPGFYGNPLATPRCKRADFVASLTPRCPGNTQIGIADVQISGSSGSPPLLFHVPVFNLMPTQGSASIIAFSVDNNTSYQEITLNPDDFGVRVSDITIPTELGIQFVKETIWGIPAAAAHDADRFCINPIDPDLATIEGCPSDAAKLPYLSLPASCGGLQKTTLGVDSVEQPGVFDRKDAFLVNDDLDPAPLTGCEKVPFAPKIAASTTSRLAENPSGLDFELSLPNAGLEGKEGIAETQPEKVEVTLPEGVTLNPSAAEGLGVCSPAEFSREETFTKPGQGCPEASKLGSVLARTPLLEEPLEGALYLAKPFDNPFNSLFALYLTVRAPDRGIMVKLAGEVKPDPRTGQLITTFEDLPPLPYSSFKLHFREGARAPLVTPPHCGSFETVAKLTPFSRPNQPLSTSAFFKTEGGVNGSSCPPGGILPFAPEFSAGSLNNNAKSHSPFNMRLQRHDGEQDMTKFSSILPPGVLGKLAGVSQCPDAAIASAKAKTGTGELASPSCPKSSEIGRTLAGAGVGSVLTYVQGKLYLAAPYKGDPLSVVAITPAVAGPFDVGNVVVREALDLNPVTAEVEVDGRSSDPIPHILAGVPLKVRDLRVHVDREDFIVNPTSCDPSSAKATLFGSFQDVFDPTDDAPISLQDRYQAANCASLGFKPKLQITLKGGTRRGDHPALKAVVKTRSPDANIGGATVTLPRSAFLDQAHIRTICTRVQYAANGGSGGGCPKASQYGYAKAFTPLLDEPVQGPVYLRSSNHKLPDLVAALHGIVDVDIVGRIDSFRGGIRSSFDTTPDAPVSKFVLTMQGANKGLVVNSRNLCAGANRADAVFSGQNGKVRDFRPVVGASCAKAKKRR